MEPVVKRRTRPCVPDPQLQRVFRMSDSLFSRLERNAENAGMNKSEFVRMAITRYMDEAEGRFASLDLRFGAFESVDVKVPIRMQNGEQIGIGTVTVPRSIAETIGLEPVGEPS